jgi:hypothetical protein
MKHILFALILLFSTITAADTPPTKFKNPIFNTKLEAISRITSDRIIISTSIYNFNNEKNEKCTLIEDNDSDIVLECENSYYPGNNIIYQFVSEGYRSSYDACIIREYYYSDRTYYHNARYSGFASLAATPLPGNTCGASVNGDEFEKNLADKAKR